MPEIEKMLEPDETFAGRAGDASGIDFLPFSDNEASVREDVVKIKSSPFIPDGITPE